jgi:hypothetical protein
MYLNPDFKEPFLINTSYSRNSNLFSCIKYHHPILSSLRTLHTKVKVSKVTQSGCILHLYIFLCNFSILKIILIWSFFWQCFYFFNVCRVFIVFIYVATPAALHWRRLNLETQWKFGSDAQLTVFRSLGLTRFPRTYSNDPFTSERVTWRVTVKLIRFPGKRRGAPKEVFNSTLKVHTSMYCHLENIKITSSLMIHISNDFHLLYLLQKLVIFELLNNLFPQ